MEYNQLYKLPRRAHFEIFFMSNSDIVQFGWNEDGYESGWYWWVCEPGCLPSDPFGPFETELSAWESAQNLDMTV